MAAFPARAPRWCTPPSWPPSGTSPHPAWRARAVGVYRLWRDGGFAIGALLAGAMASNFGVTAAIWTVAALTAASGLLTAVRMYERNPRRPARQPAGAAP